jgi:hypothetical protein
MRKPSIKGSTFAGVVADMNALVEEGRISEEDLAERLTPEDLVCLKQTIATASWYDITTYNRFLELLFEVAGHGQEQYLSDRGAAAADRLTATGVYGQLDGLLRHAARLDAGESLSQQIDEFGRTFRLTATLAGSIFNFGRWRVVNDPEFDDRFRLEISEAEHFPALLVRITEGFLNRSVEIAARATVFRWTGERVSQDFIVYRMDRGVGDIQS